MQPAVPWRMDSRTKESASSGGPHSEMTLRSTGGNERMTARSKRVLLVLTMLTFMTVGGQPRRMAAEEQEDAVLRGQTRGSFHTASRGTELESSAAAVTRSRSLAAQTAA